ncbi:hypothetical protein PN836_011455 [Ningiella sp. W23]|uniref:hypothetical protein n=1 Tax=Ningiella sp. W23 TaxID=3023715 RepID=UPI003756BA13
MKCRYCQNEIADTTIKCGHCQEYPDGDQCANCFATVPKGALSCRYCQASMPRMAGAKEKIPQLEVKAELFPSFLFRFRLIPHEVTTDAEKLTFKAPGLFYLWTDSHEIPWNKVAGFSYRSGIFWDKVEIETRGQKPSIIIGLSKPNGSKVRAILQSLEI